MFTVIWFVVWWTHGFPNLGQHWNPWLIWLSVCFFILDGGPVVYIRGRD